MFIGRKEEKKQLESVYDSDHSNMLILYGRQGIGKTCLALNFATDKQYIYFKCNEVSPLEQRHQIEALSRQIEDLHKSFTDQKLVIIIDEFHFLNDEEASQRLVSYITEEQALGKYMVILISSSINWIENKMINENKILIRAVTGIIKLKELTFAETVEWFPKASVEDCIAIRSVFGGVPAYLSLWQENRRFRENIVSLFFSADSPLYHEAEYFLKTELRELSAYNTILIALASGRYKLNEIYEYTGFSRAKISVYLKNLTEMDIVEKIYSVNVKYSENTKKGLYRIKDNFLNFWYAYVMPNIAQVETGRGKALYNEMIAPILNDFLKACFTDVCKEYLDIMSRYKKLGYRYTEWHSWVGKKGTIDIIGQDTERHMLAAVCTYLDRPASMEEYDDFKRLINLSGIKPQKLCMFSKSGFTREVLEATRAEGILTVAMSEM